MHLTKPSAQSLHGHHAKKSAGRILPFEKIRPAFVFCPDRLPVSFFLQGSVKPGLRDVHRKVKTIPLAAFGNGLAGFGGIRAQQLDLYLVGNFQILKLFLGFDIKLNDV